MKKKKFIGRKKDLQILNGIYNESKSSIVVLYGRRRVGKSHFVTEFARNKAFLSFEGIEQGQTQGQLDHFLHLLRPQVKHPLLEDVVWKRWTQALDFITNESKANSKKVVILFDEFQWMSCMQGRLTALIKSYWDQYWQHSNKIMLILCGSISSFMVQKVIHSKALYGRIRLERNILPLSLVEIGELLENKRGEAEVLKYYLVFGGIPKYYEWVDISKSFEQNIERICFRPDSSLENEYEKVFYSQFREARIYQEIVDLLIERPLTFSEITKKLKLPPSGGSRFYLKNLELANFISAFQPFNSQLSTQLTKFKLTDEFIIFYRKYIQPSRKIIKEGFDTDFFRHRVQPIWKPWLGYAFETFCLKKASTLAHIMGFANRVESFGPYFNRKEKGFQFDLIYQRTDKVITICEIKYLDSPVDLNIVNELEAKIRKVKWTDGYTLERALIAPRGVARSVIAANYFHHIVDLKRLCRYC